MFQPTVARFAQSLEEVVECIPRANFHLLLLLACDCSSLSDSSVQDALRPLFEQGLVYLCTWGPDCERVHDLADHLTLDKFGDDLVMTTWHDEKSLGDVVWYLMNCAEPANAAFSDDCDQVAVAVGSRSWYEQIEVALGKLQDDGLRKERNE